PRSRGVLPSGSWTGGGVWYWTSCSSMPTCESAERCCATTIGWCTSSCKPERSLLMASRPPHEVPITISSYTSLDPPIDALSGIDDLVVIGVGAECNRLLVPERENAEH